jgi:predicted Fe-Mo cluster-binding NifX family protein
MRDRNGGTELDTIPSGYHVNVTESRDVAESRQEWPLMVVRVVVPITDEGMVDGRWGRAERVAVAEVNNGTINNWCEFDVAWDRLHDSGTEGAHHARVARFLREQEASVVIAERMGEGMTRMLEKLGLVVRLGAAGDARAAACGVER